MPTVVKSLPLTNANAYWLFGIGVVGAWMRVATRPLTRAVSAQRPTART